MVARLGKLPTYQRVRRRNFEYLVQKIGYPKRRDVIGIVCKTLGQKNRTIEFSGTGGSWSCGHKCPFARLTHWSSSC